MTTILLLLCFGVIAGSCLVGAAGKLPLFTVERWVSSTPLTVEALRGKVVLLDIWEYTIGDRSHRTSDGGVDGPTTARGVSVERGASLVITSSYSTKQACIDC
jgi:hypothetical protein